MSGYDSYSHIFEPNGRAGRQVYVPPDMTEPMYMGTRVGDDPIQLRCGHCGYNGPSEIRKERGPANVMATALTLGLARKKAMETHHYCPGCHKDCAYSKPY